MLQVPFSSLLHHGPNHIRPSSEGPRPPVSSKLRTLVHNKHASFLVKLTVHDITNVPLVSGGFSVRWKFRGTKGELDLKPDTEQPNGRIRQSNSSHSLRQSTIAPGSSSSQLMKSGRADSPSIASTAETARSSFDESSRPSSTGASTPEHPPTKQDATTTTTTTTRTHKASQSSVDSTISSASNNFNDLVDSTIRSTLLPLPINIRPPETNDNNQKSSLIDPSNPIKKDKSTHPHVPHILLHRSENGSHSSLSSAFGFGRHKRGNDEDGQGHGVGGGRKRFTSLSSSVQSDSTSTTSERANTPTGSTRQSLESNREGGSGCKRIDVPLGTASSSKGRTAIEPLEDHGASWEYDIAQIVRMKIRPMGETELKELQRAQKSRVPKITAVTGTGHGHGQGGQGSVNFPQGSDGRRHKGEEGEIAGWLGGGPRSESGLKLVVYQHTNSFLETIRSVSTRSGERTEQEDTASLTSAREGRMGLRRGKGKENRPDPGVFFGELDLDLAEYASEEARMGKGGVTRRYLLKGGKTNAMIKLTIELVHHGGETRFVTPALQRGHAIAGITNMEDDMQMDQHLGKFNAPPHSPASSSSLSLSQTSSLTPSVLARTASVNTFTAPDHSLSRPKKPPEAHFLEPEQRERFNHLYKRGYRNHGHRAVHNAIKDGQSVNRHRARGAYAGDWSAEQVINHIFQPTPVRREDKVTPFTYYAPEIDEGELTAEEDESRADTASIVESTNTLNGKRSKRFLNVLKHRKDTWSSTGTPREEGSEKEKGLQIRPRWGRNRTKLQTVHV